MVADKNKQNKDVNTSNKSIENYSNNIWQKNNISDAKIDCEDKSLVIMMPPPTVTGSLHIGHALNILVEAITQRLL